MAKLSQLARETDRAFHQKNTAHKVRASFSRRTFLLTGFGSAMGAGLAFGFARQARASIVLPPLPAGAQLPAADTLFEPTIWCTIAPDGEVTVNIVRAEMGQHVGTALARIIADEMDADWNRVRIDYVNTEKRFAGQYVTGGSWSVWATWDLFRQAGAAARYLLVQEAARLLGTTPEACRVNDGIVVGPNGSLTFGQIVSHAADNATLLKKSLTPQEMAALPLKTPQQRTLIGRPVAALDIPPKVTGHAVYGCDVHFDDMVYARPKLPPTRYGARVRRVDDSQSRKVPGYERFIVLDDPTNEVQGWVVVIAKSWPAAKLATDLLKVEWTPTPAQEVSEADLLVRARKLHEDPRSGTNIYDDPGVGKAFDTAEETFSQTYTTAPVAHFTLEPVNATARLHEGIWEIHTGNQWQSLILPTLAKAAGVPQDQVRMITYYLGGGFGRRLNGDYAVPALLASKALGGRPVKLMLARNDDMAFDSIRSPSFQSISCALDYQNKGIRAMRYDVVAGWPTLAAAPAFMAEGMGGKKYDPFALSGADHWYDVGPFHLRAICNDLANQTFRPGWLRAVSAGWTPWALESYIDEAADQLDQDPVAFRLAMLDGKGRNAGSAPNAIGGAHRQAAVLQRLAELINWPDVQDTLPSDTGIGIATTFGQERNMPTWTAGAAQVHVNQTTGQITCQKIWLVVDAGTIVDPDGARAQIEGGALWGLSMALFEGTEIVHGTIAARNLNNYTPLRMGDDPEIEIVFMDNTYKPMGLGEPGVTVVAPAIGNAIYNASGFRLRHLPMRPQDILTAQKQGA
ncbi:xanthine dehydrogenase family protein molybdopterin-binding subunit [Oecophyllibacter saccharovorans]|uniref:xanthine dehydrogenase family protein molybdopterin-binding subunit n=1 Tax=Oecophyllibacter saccharovorans TaxID=2558360 RepID=UPI0011427D61|nr:molybdopterin cofactor-binding domain-containing protein [Oecophyllibacter saccharovorans]QDH15351.1 xanthine dehydrogenase family protein molybdopterin-binding subunit [Oecophyllibacter saccharovorans]